MTETDKAYIAGIIDGEGSIMLIRHKAGTFPSPTISIASTTLELLDYLKSTIGSGTVRRKNNYRPSVHLDSFTYELRSDKVIHLLHDIYPYLKIESKKKKTSQDDNRRLQKSYC